MFFGFSFSYEDSQDPPLMSSHTQPSMLTGGSQGPPWMSPTPSPPGSLGDPKGIPGSSLDVPPTQPSRQSGGYQGHPRILSGCPPTPSPPGSLEDPKDNPGFSLVVPTHTTLRAVQRIPRTSQDLLSMSPCTQPFRQSKGSQGHPRILPQ